MIHENWRVDRNRSKLTVANREFQPLKVGSSVRHACAVDSPSPALGFLLLLFSGWVNRQQQAVIDYLLEENRVLRAERGPHRLRLTDDQRRRLAVKGKVLGRRRLAGIAGIVTPDTILRWYRTLVAKKYDGSNARRIGRPRTKADLAALVVRMAQENPTWGSYEGPRCQDPFVSKGNLHTLTIAAEADSS